MLHLSPHRLYTELGSQTPLFAQFYPFALSREQWPSVNSSLLCPASAHWSIGLWKRWEQLAQASGWLAGPGFWVVLVSSLNQLCDIGQWWALAYWKQVTEMQNELHSCIALAILLFSLCMERPLVLTWVEEWGPRYSLDHQDLRPDWSKDWHI